MRCDQVNLGSRQLRYLLSLTAQDLYSGVPVIGSLCSDVRIFVSALSKWNVMKTVPFCERFVTFAFAFTEPLFDDTVTKSPLFILSFTASSGFISTSSSGTSSIMPGTLLV